MARKAAPTKKPAKTSAAKKTAASKKTAPATKRAPATSKTTNFGDYICNVLPSKGTENDWQLMDSIAAGTIGAPAALPASVDLRAAWWTINDQENTGSCVGWATADGRIVLAREDVGRHNALDKLAGSLARDNVVCSAGIVVLTSRVSVEMVQAQGIVLHSPAVLQAVQACLPASHGLLTPAKVRAALAHAGG